MARPDAAATFVVFAAALLYVVAQPYNLGIADESYFLIEAKRIREGEVMYRDLFQLHAPASHWFMAAMFWLFGTSIRTARLVMAVVHAGIAAILFATGRRLGVPRWIACAPAAAYLALCHAAWPYSSAHWIAALFMALLLYLAAGRRTATAPRWALRPGLAVGGLTIVMHQQGAVFAVAVAALFALDHGLGRRYGDTREWRDLFARLVCFSLGIAVVVLPVVAYLLATIDWGALYFQFIIHPLTGYRKVNSARWGQMLPLTASMADSTYPLLLKYLPLVAVTGAARAAWLWTRRADRARFDALLGLLTMCGGAALAIAYLPDFIHIAFIGALFLVFWAEEIDAAVRVVGRRLGAEAGLGAAVGLGLLVALAVPLARNLERMHRSFPFVHDTPFGPVAFSSEREIKLVETVRALMDTTPTRELFVYPMYTSLYLTTDSDNPTPHVFVMPGYNTPDQVQEVLDILEAKKLPYVIAMELFVKRDTDPILRYVAQHYDCYDWGDNTCGLWKRRPETP